MANESTNSAVVSIPGIPQVLQQLPSDVMQVSNQMILLTWLAFGITAALLHRILWRPLLKAVKRREDSISEALTGAEEARRELAESGERKKQMEREARHEAQLIMERAAQEAAAKVARADEEAQAQVQRRLEEGERTLATERGKAFESVRRAAAEHLLGAVENFVRNELTEEQRKAYQESVLGEVQL